MSRFEFTRKATIAVIVTPTILSLGFAGLAMLGGAPIKGVLFVTILVIAAWIAVATPFVMLLGFTRDAVVETKRISDERKVIRTRKKNPVVGAMSVVDDRPEGALSETSNDEGALSRLPTADNHSNVRS